MPKIKSFNPDLFRAIQQLYWWQYSGDRSPSFYDLLFVMFQKADVENLQRLRRGFPAHYMAWRLWYESTDQDGFFKVWLGDESEREKQP